MNNIIDNRNRIECYSFERNELVPNSEGSWISKIDFAVNYLKGLYNNADEHMRPLFHKMVIDMGLRPTEVFE